MKEYKLPREAWMMIEDGMYEPVVLHYWGNTVHWTEQETVNYTAAVVEKIITGKLDLVDISTLTTKKPSDDYIIKERTE